MNADTTTPTMMNRVRTPFRWTLALVAVALMVWTVGCDSNGGSSNERPTASFEMTANDLTVSFTDNSSDPDGSIASREWSFGDGETAESANPSHTYAQGGTYTVTLEVTDNEGATASMSQDVTVGAPSPNYANYDTTSVDGKTWIIVNEQDPNEGIGHPDENGNLVNEVTWSSDYTYVLDGRVFVNEGQTLTIEPGTVVRGRARLDPENASVLIVARGGTIMADGTPDEPIIFTAEEDDLSDPTDFTRRGAWGGVILLGRSPTNNQSQDVNIEGIPTSEARAAYGGNDPADNSGVFRYVSIRYGGISIGAGNEINGLTMGAVGSETTIEYVEVYKNQDDCFEWFSSTVNTKHLVGAYCGDDTFDIDQGFRGKGQFWFAVQDPDAADRTAEHDGGDSDLGANGEASEPWATPQIYNATYIGSSNGGDGDIALKLRDNWAGSYFNSIFAGFPVEAIEIEDVDGTDTGDSRARFEDGTLQLRNNIFHNFGAGDTFRALVENGGSYGDTIADSLESWENRIVDPQLANIARLDPSLDPRPAASGPAASGAITPGDSFYDDVSYIGAFDPNGDNWAAGWSFAFQQ